VIEQEQKLVYGLKANTYVFNDWLTAALTSHKGCTLSELEQMKTACDPVRCVTELTLQPCVNQPEQIYTLTIMSLHPFAFTFCIYIQNTKKYHQKIKLN